MAQSNSRETFSSRLGFILAAAGAAVGLGNIWGFYSSGQQWWRRIFVGLPYFDLCGRLPDVGRGNGDWPLWSS